LAAVLGNRRVFSRFDWGLFTATLLIPFLGLIVLYSAGYDPEAPRFLFQPTWIPSVPFFKQIVFLVGGLAVFGLAASIPASLLYHLAYPFYGAGVFLLVLVNLFGEVQNGSRRWLDLGPVHLQPSEFMKLGVVLVMARFLSKFPPPEGGYRLHHLILPVLLFGVPMALIMDQPDLGTALAVGGCGFMMTLFLGINRKAMLLMLLGLCAVVPLGWSSLHGYQQARILNLFDPEHDPKGTGYHVNQSKIAVGSGQLFGKGFLDGTQTQLEFLPEHTTDFIFSVLAEEWGFVGCVGVLCAYFFFLYRLLRVSAKARDLFQALVVFGIASKFFFHTIVNIGMVVGLLPVVGIPLPLFSYGGSALLSNLFAVGIVMGISMRRKGYAIR
jgi:rod shape determining protein RodA